MYNFQIDKPVVAPEHPLNQPGVLQNQIVEYTKYRGLETILERFEILNAFDKISEEQKKNEKVAAKMSDMSELDTAWGGIAADVKNLKGLVSEYNKMLASYAGVKTTDYKSASSSSTVKLYENKASNEILDLARKTDKITTGRGTYKTKLQNAGTDLVDKYDEIMRILSELKDYTQEHFRDEEACMEEMGYPDLDKQRQAHEAFVEKLAEIDLDSMDDNQQEYLEELIDFLLNWLSVHILHMDKKIGEYANSQK